MAGSDAMNVQSLAVPADPFASVLSAAVQREAAELAESGFARAFRLSTLESAAARAAGLASLQEELERWVNGVAEDPEDESLRALRLAMLLSGLDQWGLAWSQAFGLVSIAGLSELVGALRHQLDPRAEALLLQRYGEIDAAEENLIDFKLGVRRGIHLALWHAAIACESQEEANNLVGCLGGLMLGLTRAMPQLGWRLLADTLAFIQIRCLGGGLAVEGVGQQATQALLGALDQALAPDIRAQVMSHAAQAVLAWQHEQRARTQLH